MKVRYIGFGEIKIEGVCYSEDVVIEGGKVRPRDKKPSKAFKARYGHTPLSIQEAIPWDCQRLIIGTGAHGALPVMDEVRAEARRRGVELVAVPTPEACALLKEADLRTTNAILHLTC